jgi:hypothetical protein
MNFGLDEMNLLALKLLGKIVLGFSAVYALAFIISVFAGTGVLEKF